MVISLKIKTMLCKIIFKIIFEHRRINNLSKYLLTINEIQKKYEEIPKIYFYTLNNKANVFLKFKNDILKDNTVELLE